MNVQMLFNPTCSKCRTVRGVLEEHGVQIDYVRYLERVPSREQLEEIMKLLEIEDPRDMMRVDEPIYAELGLMSADRETLLGAMQMHPILIQRPIVIVGKRAVIGRPPERVLELIDPSSAERIEP